MLLWLMPVAFAGTAVEEMDAIALARQPALAVACSPSAAVYQSLQGLFQLPFVSSRLGAVAGPELVQARQRVLDLEVENQALRQRIDGARDRLRMLSNRLSFLEQDADEGAA